MKLETLKSRIGNADYEVDTDAVAEAIVRRLMGARAGLYLGVEAPSDVGPGSPAPTQSA